MTTNESYLAGRAAYARGALKSDNPFPRGSELHQPWIDGWHDSQNSGWVKGKYDRADVPCDIHNESKEIKP